MVCHDWDCSFLFSHKHYLSTSLRDLLFMNWMEGQGFLYLVVP